MADKVEIEFKSDTGQVVRELDDARRAMGKLEDATEDVADASRNTGDRLGDLGDKADGAETRIMGTRDTVDGLATIMQGPGEQGISSYLQGWADLASGMYNAVIPALKAGVTAMAGNIKQAVLAGVEHAKAAAIMVAGWIKMGIQSTIGAAKVAAAWLISIGPIAIAIAAIAGLVVVVIKNWDTIKEFLSKIWEWLKGAVAAVKDWIVEKFTAVITFFTELPGKLRDGIKNLASMVWDPIKNGASKVKDFVVEQFGKVKTFFSELPGKIGEFFVGLAEVITAPFRLAFNAVAAVWNNTVGKLSFRVPDWIPGIGGKGWDVPDIPTFHSGGIFRAPTPGGEGFALLRDGEKVSTPGSDSGGGTEVIQVALDGRVIAEVVRNQFNQIQRRNGTLGFT